MGRPKKEPITHESIDAEIVSRFPDMKDLLDKFNANNPRMRPGCSDMISPATKREYFLTKLKLLWEDLPKPFTLRDVLEVFSTKTKPYGKGEYTSKSIMCYLDSLGSILMYQHELAAEQLAVKEMKESIREEMEGLDQFSSVPSHDNVALISDEERPQIVGELDGEQWKVLLACFVLPYRYSDSEESFPLRTRNFARLRIVPYRNRSSIGSLSCPSS